MNVKLFIVLLAVSQILTFSHIIGQQSTNATEYGLQIISTAEVIQKDDPFEVSVLNSKKGDGSQLFTELDIKLVLGAGVPLPTKGDLNCGHSWFIEDVEGVEFSVDPILRTVRVVAKLPQGKSGTGELFRLKLTSGQDNLQTSTLVHDGGSIIHIIDIGFRQLAVQSAPDAPSPVCFPNPTREELHFNLGADLPREIRVINNQGQLIRTLLPSSATVHPLDTRELPMGTYYFHFIYPSHPPVARRITIL